MTFIGNDIMCFADNIHTFNRKGVTEKILSENELNILSFFNQQNTLIVAWTIKESIYKILCKEGYRKAFAPKNIVITENCYLNKKSCSGIALFSSRKYFYRTEVNKDFVYTFASNNSASLKYIDTVFFSNKVSDYTGARNYSLTKYLDKHNLELEHNTDGIPYIKNKKKNFDITITHDYNMLAIGKLESFKEPCFITNNILYA